MERKRVKEGRFKEKAERVKEENDLRLGRLDLR